MKYSKKKDIAKKIAQKTHTSSKRAVNSILPFIKVCFKKDKEFSKKIIKELKLSDDEINYLRTS